MTSKAIKKKWVKRAPAYWKYTTKPFSGYSCTNCHEKYDERDYKTVWKFKFCPQCGCVMIGVLSDKDA